MPYEIISGWQSDSETAIPRGWYRYPTGRLRYWDGQAWAGSQTVELLSGHRLEGDAAVGGAAPGAIWARLFIVAGWIAVIMCLGLMLSDVEVTGAHCGTLFDRSEAVESTARLACTAALETRAVAMST